MIDNASRLVGPDAIRPARPDGTCFYCYEPLAHEHKTDCVLRKRSVVVRAVIEYVIWVPESWDAAMIEFHRGGSSWCANNMLKDLEHIGENGCLCNNASHQFIREAGLPDHEWLGEPRRES